MYVNRHNRAYICLPSSRFSHPLQVFVCELERLTVLPAERWAGLLADAEADVARRAVSLQAEATRLADNKTLTGVCLINKTITQLSASSQTTTCPSLVCL